MSEDIFNSIPEKFREVFRENVKLRTKAKNAITVQKEAEKIRQEVRDTSKIYKIFGENMFGFLSSDKTLLLEIGPFDIDELKDTIEKIETLTMYRVKILEELGNKKYSLTIPNEQGELETREVVVASRDMAHELRDYFLDLKTIFETKFLDMTGQVYLSQKDRTTFSKVRSMCVDLQKQRHSKLEERVLRENIKPLPIYSGIKYSY